VIWRILLSLSTEDQMMEQLRQMTDEPSRMIFVSSCIEAVARRENIPATEMYRRMSRVGMIHHYILPYYDVLHTQSRQYVTDTLLETLHNWEAAGMSMAENHQQLFSSSHTARTSRSLKKRMDFLCCFPVSFINENLAVSLTI